MKRLISILVALSVWGIACAQPSVRIAHGPYLQQVTDNHGRRVVGRSSP